MNKNIKIGDRVSGEFEPISIESVIKVSGIYDGIGVRGLAKIITEDGLVVVVPSSLRKLVKKKKPYDNFLTSKGFEFQRTARGWIDQTSKLEWMNEFKAGMNRYDSEKWAQGQGMRLPTREEFIEAEKHGVRELPGMVWEGCCFWSASVSPDFDFYAYHFSGSCGYIDGDHRDDSHSDVAARCVSPAGQGAGVG